MILRHVGNEDFISEFYRSDVVIAKGFIPWPICQGGWQKDREE